MRVAKPFKSSVYSPIHQKSCGDFSAQKMGAPDIFDEHQRALLTALTLLYLIVLINWLLVLRDFFGAPPKNSTLKIIQTMCFQTC
jgi:hypothetical protein